MDNRERMDVKSGGEKNVVSDFLELNDVEKQALKERVAVSGGVIRLFVHPSFMIQNHHEKALKLFPGHERVETVIKRIIALPEEKTPPVILMCEHKHVQETKSRFAEESKQKIYIIETEDADPDVYGRNDGFKQMVDLFAELGVRKVIVGGQVLWIDTDDLKDAGNLKIPSKYGYEDQSPLLSGCVGKVVSKLNDDRFSVEISSASYPDTPRKMRGVLAA